MLNKIALSSTRSRLEKGQKKNQRGISLILVLFLLVVVSLLAAALIQLNRGSSNAVSMETQSARALFAAESGAQIAAMRIFPINGAIPAACPFVDLTQNFNTTGLTGCRANLHCEFVSAAGRNVFTITSEGQCSLGTNDYARRRITVGLRSL